VRATKLKNKVIINYEFNAVIVFVIILRVQKNEFNIAMGQLDAEEFELSPTHYK